MTCVVDPLISTLSSQPKVHGLAKRAEATHQALMLIRSCTDRLAGGLLCSQVLLGRFTSDR